MLMDFLDPAKKRAHRIRLYIGYVLMAILIGFATLILVYHSTGFDYDRQTGTVIQKGLVFIDAKPEAATIKINNEDKGRTDQRLSLAAGDYTVILERAGYRTWQRHFTLEGGSIERLVYPLLFPTELTSTQLDVYGALPDVALQSPDKHWLLIGQPGQINTFAFYDLQATPVADVPLVFPETLFSKSTGQNVLKLVEWSSDNRHILVEHLFNQDDREFIVLDRENPAASYNVNATFSIKPSQVALRDKKFDSLYILNHDTATLVQTTLRDRSLVPIKEKVVSFKSHGTNVLSMLVDDGVVLNKFRVVLRDNNKEYILRDMPKNDQYFLDIARYNDNWYYVVGAASENKVYNYRNPVTFLKRNNGQKPAPIAILKADKPMRVSFSQTSRFIAVQSQNKFAVYDAEHDKQYNYELKQSLTSSIPATWMDGHRLVSVSENKAFVFDFDSSNAQALSASDGAFAPIFDRDSKVLYTLAPTSTAGRYELLSTSLKANQ
jgi:hypothetical protein